MMMFRSSTVFIAFASIVIGSSGIDPIVNYCWRLDHQSTVKNGTLYIDGGVEVFADENNNGSATGELSTGYTTSLIAIDMRSSWDWQKNISITALNKTANPDTGTEPPVVVDAAIYSGSSSDSNIYLYGGTVSYVNTSSPGYQKPTSSQYALWSYDTTEDTWGQYDVSVNAPIRPAGGAYAEAPDQGLAFWLNGYITNGTSNSLEVWDGLYEFLDGLVVIDTETQTATNVSTSSLEKFPRVKGGLTYLPDIGSKGILVSLGGVTKSTSDTTDSNPGSYVSFDEIDFLDIASLDGSETGTWHTQRTTGDVPDGRTDFCVITASAKDNSSHNIYLYGGQSTGKVYDQIYVLSIPSFIWTRIFEGSSPRYAHTCHLVGNRQMLTVGGKSSTTTCDWETKGVAIYDMSTLNWGSKYDAEADEYKVPAQVYHKTGGGGNGNANIKQPRNGFSTPEISKLFGTTNSNKDSISGGAIAGAVIGSIAGAGLIASLILFVIWRRRKQASAGQLLNGTDKPDGFMGPAWRNRDGERVELPNSEVPGQQPYGVPANPVEIDGTGGVQEMDGTDIRHELPPSNGIVEKG